MLPPKKKGYHRHHIIPKHLGGDDSPENIKYLTPEEHIQAHIDLFEKYGNAADAHAVNILSKNWCGRTIDGYKQTPEHIEKRISAIDYEQVSKKLKGRRSPTKGMTFEYRAKPKIGDAQRGKPKSEETKRKISESKMGSIPVNKIEFYCVYCRKRIAPCRIDRHGPGKKACIR